MVGAPIMLISAKTVQVTLPLLLVAALAGVVARHRYACLRLPCDGATLTLLALLLYAGLSALWAPEPLPSIGIVLMAVVVSAGSLVLMRLLRSEDFENACHIGEGLWIGLIAGLLYTIAEASSGQAIKIWVYNALGLGPDVLEPARYFTWENGRLISVHPDDLTRNVVPIPLLIWPALMAACALAERTWRLVLCTALLLLSVAAVFLATSEAAKLAILAGALAFAMARYATRLAHYALSFSWIVACIAVVPAALLARQLELQAADWLPLSAQLRIVIWNEIAQIVPHAPIFGVGADMTYFIRPMMHEAPAGTLPFPITHPHNVYLQVWYELGIVGVTLLTTFGLLLLRQIARLRAVQRPFGFALFAAAAVQIAFSYNVWQIWFMCLFGFAAAMFAVGQALLRAERASAEPRESAILRP